MWPRSGGEMEQLKKRSLSGWGSFYQPALTKKLNTTWHKDRKKILVLDGYDFKDGRGKSQRSSTASGRSPSMGVGSAWT
jgi:hypothetical protein